MFRSYIDYNISVTQNDDCIIIIDDVEEKENIKKRAFTENHSNDSGSKTTSIKIEDLGTIKIIHVFIRIKQVVNF